jgi:hypothetical protein
MLELGLRYDWKHDAERAYDRLIVFDLRPRLCCAWVLTLTMSTIRTTRTFSHVLASRGTRSGMAGLRSGRYAILVDQR